MPNSSAIRIQIESALADRIPSALTPAPRVLRPVNATCIESVDELLKGGLPVGAITELVGKECSGRTSFALSFVAGLTQAAKVCAWIDVSNALNPESAAASGVDLTRLLWVRCGAQGQLPPPQRRIAFSLDEKYRIAPPVKRGLHGGGFGGHPRMEAKGISVAVDRLLRPADLAPRRVNDHGKGTDTMPHSPRETVQSKKISAGNALPSKAWTSKPWSKMEQALRVADLVLQGGGFSAIVLDLSSISPEQVARVPLATWFRYRAVAESTQASILLLTQHSCSKSSAELLLRLQPGDALRKETTVFTGMEHGVEVARQRFVQTPSNILPLRKPPQKANSASWQSHTAWAARR